MRNECDYDLTVPGVPGAATGVNLLGGRVTITFTHNNDTVRIRLPFAVAQDLTRKLARARGGFPTWEEFLENVQSQRKKPKGKG